MEKDLPAVLNVALGMGKHVGELAESMKTVINGVVAVGTSAGGDAMTTGRLVACLSPMKGALDAVTSVQANVSVSVNVQASASDSAKSG